jgi:hypothetical protein
MESNGEDGMISHEQVSVAHGCEKFSGKTPMFDSEPLELVSTSGGDGGGAVVLVVGIGGPLIGDGDGDVHVRGQVKGHENDNGTVGTGTATLQVEMFRRRT